MEIHPHIHAKIYPHNPAKMYPKYSHSACQDVLQVQQSPARFILSSSRPWLPNFDNARRSRSDVSNWLSGLSPLLKLVRLFSIVLILVWPIVFLHCLLVHLWPPPSELGHTYSWPSLVWRGAIFSAICGWKSIPINAPEPYKHRECYWLLVFSTRSNFFALHMHTASAAQWAFQMGLWWSRPHGFVRETKQTKLFPVEKQAA